MTRLLLIIALIVPVSLPAQEWNAWKVVGKKRRALIGDQGGGSGSVGFSPTSLAFGLVPVGEYAELNFTVTNSTQVSDSGIAYDAGEFYVVAGSPWVVGSLSAASVTIRYAPSSSSWTGYSTNSVPIFYGQFGTLQTNIVCTGNSSAAEGFEGPGPLLAWTTGGQTVPDLAFASTNMVGSYVARRSVSNKQGYARHTMWASTRPVYGYFMYRWSSGSGNIASFRDGAAAQLAEVGINASRQFTLTMPGATAVAMTTAIPAGGTNNVHVWFYYNGGTGWLAWNTSATFPATNSTSYYRTITNSTATANAVVLQLGSAANNTITDHFDKVRYAVIGFGSSPL